MIRIRQIINAWLNWRSRKAMRRAIPVLRELDRQHAEYRRSHRRGSAAVIKAKQRAVHARLAAETGQNHHGEVA